MEEVESLSGGCLANQILYNLEYRGTEYDLLEHDRKTGTVTMAYSPLGQGGDLLEHPAMREVASRHETSLGPATTAQIALAWVLRRPNILAIPKASSPGHVESNIASLELALSDADLKTLDGAFPPPNRKLSLAMI